MPSLRQLIKQTTASITFYGVPVNFTYSQQQITLEAAQRAQDILTRWRDAAQAAKAAQANGERASATIDGHDLADFLSTYLVNWDLTENDDVTIVPLTVERLTRATPKDEVVPWELQVDLLSALIDTFPTQAAQDTPAPQPQETTLLSETDSNSISSPTDS